jgi:ubiquinol-cytochrome c reductase iron-sulfur subunit
VDCGEVVTVVTKKDPLEEPRQAPAFDVDDPELTRFDLVREGARRDGVEIVHYAPRFPVRGTKAEKRVERTIAFLFLLAGAAATAFVVAFIWWPWKYESDSALEPYYTPVLGVTLGLALFAIGAAIIVFSKKLLPEEIAVQDRHDGASPTDERALTGATLLNMADETGISRRPLLKGAIALGLAPVAAVPVVALGGLINDPHNEDMFNTTGFHPGENGERIRLVRENETPIRPEEISAGGQITVFPGIPHGDTNEYADSPTLLIHLRQQDADELRTNVGRVAVNADAMFGNYVAYSKICTHAGCPASLYEQQTNRLLCPCHQSQFQITDNARPIFGPATRRLPMLPIEVDDEGYFVAKSDYRVPVGPGFWERP